MTSTRRPRVTVDADGAARGNPGPAGCGALVRDTATGEVLAERTQPLGVATNNVAEYSGLIAGLTAAADLGAAEVEVRMDSRLVIEQMSGRWQIRHPGLRPLAAQAADLISRFDVVRFVWVPREENTRADELANAAVDGQTHDPVVTRGLAATVPTATSWSPPPQTATRLVLVRHGETERTAGKRYSGRGDVPLSERGVTQADAIARRIAATVSSPATVLTSPLSRCTQTANAITRELGLPEPRVEVDLIECDFGDWEGRTFAEVRDQWPAELRAWLGATAIAPPGGESFDVVAARVRDLLARVLANAGDETVVMVSHVTPIKLILRDALAGGPGFLHRLYLDPAGVSVVDSWGDGGVAVRTVNDTSHLREI